MTVRLLLISLQLLVACAPELRLGELPGTGSGGSSSAEGGGAGPDTGGASSSGAGGGTSGSGAGAGGEGGSGAGGGGEAGSGPGGSGGGGAGGTDCARDSSCLTDDGLVARYFLDEARAGSAPTQVEDAAAAPMPLALTYGPEMSFAADGPAHSGLSWTAVAADSRASAAIDGTKIHTALHGSRTGTIEAVLRVAEVVIDGSRIIHIGSGTESGRFTLRSEQPGQIELWWNGTNCGGAWDAALPARAVVHGVFDTTVQEPAADRVRLYINGVLAPRSNPIVGYCTMHKRVPPLDATLDLAEGRHLVLGNRELGGRTFSGAMYYAALYARALTAAEIERHTAALLARDDRPGP
ncbi:LamG-like jellyroll fold domain-containing protein [Sorangium sp. So ce119]|uniref:LamG-like jellyroll fold domain-containing protein n=1 Tax=Sorangium sp. So ce119 TaxID=3133279 RepID=UPI003F62D1B4